MMAGALMTTLLLCSCGVEAKDYSSMTGEGEERVTLAQLVTPGSEKEADTPEVGVTADVTEPVEEVSTPTPTPIPTGIPYYIRTSLAPALVNAKASGDNDKVERVLGQIWDEDPAWADKFRAVAEHWDVANSAEYVNVFADTEYIREDVIQNGMNTTVYNGRLMFPEKL